MNGKMLVMKQETQGNMILMNTLLNYQMQEIIYVV
uniref:Uncharacterized protein n=1 Tax=viral metagenome TaxID=1070528 RepID=A0A6C0DLI2_9ZZZZ